DGPMPCAATRFWRLPKHLSPRATRHPGQGRGATLLPRRTIMKACCWYGKNDVRVETVPDPTIENPRDAIIKVNLTAICGSDLHLLHGAVPRMEPGDILGHEFMGEVMEVGPGNQKLKRGDRVVVPFAIACGNCFYCRNELWSLCDNSNPDATTLEKIYG